MTDLRREPPHPRRGELPIRREPCKMDGISEHIVISRHRRARARRRLATVPLAECPAPHPELAIAAVSITGYFGFLFGPPAIGLVAERFGLATGLGVIGLALAVVALRTAGALSEGAEKRWMVSLSAWK